MNFTDFSLKIINFMGCVAFTALAVDLLINPIAGTTSGFTLFLVFLFLSGFLFVLANQPLSKPKQDLLSILKTNGTGILEGTCLVKGARDKYGNGLFKREDDVDPPPVHVNFSLGAQYLGCYLFRGEDGDEIEEKRLEITFGRLVLEEGLHVEVTVYLDRTLEVVRFVAQLMPPEDQS
jgi:hypothetical protein